MRHGCLAERLLERTLPPDARYVEVRRAEGQPRLPVDDGACDRVLSTYVLDLLSDEDIATAIAEAARVLARGGRLCLTCLIFGEGPLSRGICRLWRASRSTSRSGRQPPTSDGFHACAECSRHVHVEIMDERSQSRFVVSVRCGRHYCSPRVERATPMMTSAMATPTSGPRMNPATLSGFDCSFRSTNARRSREGRTVTVWFYELPLGSFIYGLDKSVQPLPVT